MARILIIDGNDPVRWTLANLLQFEGHEVEQAADGRQALARFVDRTFDVVLVDVYVPLMDGLEVCRRMRSRSQVPILMLSTNTDPILREMALRNGANAFLSKPLEFDGLLAWVRTMIAGGTSSTASAQLSYRH